MKPRKRTKKETLISEVVMSMKGDMYNYEDLIFELAEEGLKKWTVKELKDFLG